MEREGKDHAPEQLYQICNSRVRTGQEQRALDAPFCTEANDICEILNAAFILRRFLAGLLHSNFVSR